MINNKPLKPLYTQSQKNPSKSKTNNHKTNSLLMVSSTKNPPNIKSMKKLAKMLSNLLSKDSMELSLHTVKHPQEKPSHALVQTMRIK